MSFVRIHSLQTVRLVPFPLCPGLPPDNYCSTLILLLPVGVSPHCTVGFCTHRTTSTDKINSESPVLELIIRKVEVSEQKDCPDPVASVTHYSVSHIFNILNAILMVFFSA